jgi:predicted nucleotidyltransferase
MDTAMARPDDTMVRHEEYPRLIATLRGLVEQVRRSETLPVSLMALFGSTARLEAGRNSDADLLVLLDEAQTPVDRDTCTTELLHLIRRIEDQAGDGAHRWPIFPMLGDASASDLDPDFLAEVGRGGVLLYRRSDVRPPLPLEPLQPFDAWAARVEGLLDRLGGSGHRLKGRSAPTR